MSHAYVTDLKQLAVATGLDPELLDSPSLADFVRRHCQELGCADEPAYHELLRRTPHELERLVQEVSVAETCLFRYQASYRLLIEYLVGLRQRKAAPLKMLSIACATGEEPHSMAIAAVEAGWPLEQIAIDAVDRHEPSLAIARQGTYGDNSLREQTPDWAQRWLSRVDRQVQIDPCITATVNFLCADILAGPYPNLSGPYDVIFCRNLFIYLSQAARDKLAANLASSLLPGGLLFVGHAEQSETACGAFERVAAPHAFALRLRQTPADKRLAPDDGLSPAPGPARSATLTERPVRARAPADDTPPQRAAAPTAKPVPIPTRSQSAVQWTQPPLVPPPTSQRPDAATNRHTHIIDSARALADNGQLEEALAAVHALLAADPSAAEAYELLGSIQLAQERLDEAREAFQKVLYFRPDHEAALLQLAVIHQRTGDTQQAARYRQRSARAHQQQSHRDQIKSKADESPRQPR